MAHGHLVVRRIADAVIKRAQENELNDCLIEGRCVPLNPSQLIWFSASATTIEVAATRVLPSWRERGNCSSLCDDFLECVDNSLQDANSWLVGDGQYNKTTVVNARRRCTERADAPDCLNLVSTGLTRNNPKTSLCLNLDCYLCGLTSYERYFRCAIDCNEVGRRPRFTCCAHAAARHSVALV